MPKGIFKNGNSGLFKKGENLGNTNGFKKGHQLTKGRPAPWAKNNPQIFKKGQVSHNKGIPMSEIQKEKIRQKLTGVSRINSGTFKKGHKPSLKAIKKNRMRCGEKNNMWQGGISFEPYILDWTKTLRRSIRERDKYACQLCGEKQGDRAFSVHHIDYNKKNCNTSNLITLCRKCHGRTNTNRNYWTDYFN